MEMKNGMKIFIVLLLLVVVAGSTGCRRKAQPPPVKWQPHVQTQTGPGVAAKKGPDTVVPTGVALDAYVQKYYQAYKEKRWKEAYEMQSASAKARETLEQYSTSREGMPLADFKVEPPVIQGSTGTVTAELTLGGGGAASWRTTWSFTKKGDKWIVEGTRSSMGQ